MAAEKSPIAWAMTPLKKYATFSGRAPRAEFWWFFLFCLIAYVAMWFLVVGTVGGMAMSDTAPSAGMIGAFGAAGLFMGIFWLALLIPTLAVQTRRLHDTNRSGWWLVAFYVLYAIYMVMSFSTVFAAAAMDPTAAAAAEPNMGALGLTMILALAMMIYGIVLLVFYCLPGTPGPNAYGPDPYGHGENLETVFS